MEARIKVSQTVVVTDESNPNFEKSGKVLFYRGPGVVAVRIDGIDRPVDFKVSQVKEKPDGKD